MYLESVHTYCKGRISVRLRHVLKMLFLISWFCFCKMQFHIVADHKSFVGDVKKEYI